MKYIKISFCLFIISVLCHEAIFARRSGIRNRSDAYPGGYYNGDTLPVKTAYLTFDDGPSEWTEGILDTLKEEKVNATFFICAYWNNKKMKGANSFRRHSNALLRTVREGHVLGNHTAGHRVLTALSPAQIKKEFSLNQYYLDQVLGSETRSMTIIRPPLGKPWNRNRPLNAMIRVGSTVKNIGMVAMWTKKCDSTDSWDWARGEWYRNSARVDNRTESFLRKKERVYNRIASCAEGNGIVILFHDTHLVTKEVLSPVIKELKRKGYVFRTMEDFTLWKYGRGSRELVGLKSSH